ncbi:DUF7344 domain-containing protein [Halorarum halobium]|uniref:DUF7344 domain-containing protein n=1 Tax=Halorarum halobium TaxID=3075121 RepID=UPI0028AF8D5B|nr:hypothetical protein [Halobaculum sp. XH14]
MVEGPRQVDDLHRLLDTAQRRHLLEVLDEVDRALPVSTLVEHVAKRLHETPIRELSTEQLHSVRIRIHHNHLPKLADAAVVEHDPADDSVRTGPVFDRAVSVLRTVRGVTEAETA